MKSRGLKDYFYLSKGIFFLLILGNIGVAISMVIWSLFMKEIADTVTTNNLDEVKKLLLFGFLFLCLYFFISNFKEFCRRSFLYKVNYNLKTDVFNSILSKNINSFNSTNSAKYISILNNDISTIETDYFANIPDIIDNIITSFVALMALFIYEPSIAIVVILVCFLPILIPKLFGNMLSSKQGKYFKSLEVYNSKIKDIFNGFELIKSFNADKESKKLYNDVVTSVEDCRFSFRASYSLSIIVQETLSYSSSVIQLIFSVYLVLTGKISFGVLLGTMQVSNYVHNPVSQLGAQLIKLKSIKDIQSKVEEILNSSLTNSNDEIGLERLMAPTPIILNNLSYSYDNTNPVLKNISFTFEKGKKYAIVGSSGSGKSTLIKTIMRYYDEYDGEISIGSQDIKSIDKSSFNQYFSMIHQNVILFDDTLQNNITLFQKYTSEEIQKVIKEAGLDRLVANLPKGINSRVNESGNNLSGGEQQRISIARSFLRNSSVMLLDEATSSLDNKMAMQIENLILEKDDLTAIVVTHKLVDVVLKKYDCIIALKHGKIEEYGSFNDLISNKGYFYGLYTINSD